MYYVVYDKLPKGKNITWNKYTFTYACLILGAVFHLYFASTCMCIILANLMHQLNIHRWVFKTDLIH